MIIIVEVLVFMFYIFKYISNIWYKEYVNEVLCIEMLF